MRQHYKVDLRIDTEVDDSVTQEGSAGRNLFHIVQSTNSVYLVVIPAARFWHSKSEIEPQPKPQSLLSARGANRKLIFM
jgi:hypothetical protein